MQSEQGKQKQAETDPVGIDIVHEIIADFLTRHQHSQTPRLKSESLCPKGQVLSDWNYEPLHPIPHSTHGQAEGQS